MREIILDTETTGFDPAKGHRLVEIGCLELKNHLPTGKVFHAYVNPQREVPQDAANIHGLTYDFLKDHPQFGEHVDGFLDFIEDSPLVIHNAPFDMRFLNAELCWIGRRELSMDRAIDTLKIAKEKFPGAPASLDALCKRFGVDNSSRIYHGALLDAELLAAVYLELMGGRQPDLISTSHQKDKEKAVFNEGPLAKKQQTQHATRVFEVKQDEAKRHSEMLSKLKNPIWQAT